jgi:hypothetical protein
MIIIMLGDDSTPSFASRTVPPSSSSLSAVATCGRPAMADHAKPRRPRLPASGHLAAARNATTKPQILEARLGRNEDERAQRGSGPGRQGIIGIMFDCYYHFFPVAFKLVKRTTRLGTHTHGRAGSGRPRRASPTPLDDGRRSELRFLVRILLHTSQTAGAGQLEVVAGRRPRRDAAESQMAARKRRPEPAGLQRNDNESRQAGLWRDGKGQDGTEQATDQRRQQVSSGGCKQRARQSSQAHLARTNKSDRIVSQCDRSLLPSLIHSRRLLVESGQPACWPADVRHSRSPTAAARKSSRAAARER